MAPPRWLDTLLRQTYFNVCEHHHSERKNECNSFCLDCASKGLCQHCLHDHHGHRTLQIRRYVYHDVVQVQDMDPLFSCDGIQFYHINNAAVIFLNQRPKLRPVHNPANVCENCRRGLQDNNSYCSLACKVKVHSLKKAKTNSAGLSPAHCSSVAEDYDDIAPRTPDTYHRKTSLCSNSASLDTTSTSDEDLSGPDCHLYHSFRIKRRKQELATRSPVW